MKSYGISFFAGILFVINLNAMQRSLVLLNKAASPSFENYKQLVRASILALQKYPLDVSSYSAIKYKEPVDYVTAERAVCDSNLLLFNYGYSVDNTEIIIGSMPKLDLLLERNSELKRSIEEINVLLNGNGILPLDIIEQLLSSQFNQYNKKDWIFWCLAKSKDDNKTFLTHKFLKEILEGTQAGRRIDFIS